MVYELLPFIIQPWMCHWNGISGCVDVGVLQGVIGREMRGRLYTLILIRACGGIKESLGRRQRGVKEESGIGFLDFKSQGLRR